MKKDKFSQLELKFIQRFEKNNHIYTCSIGEYSCMIQSSNNIWIIQKYIGNLYIYIEIIGGFIKSYLFYDFKDIYEKMNKVLIEDF